MNERMKRLKTERKKKVEGVRKEGKKQGSLGKKKRKQAKE